MTGVRGKAFGIVRKYKHNAAKYPFSWQDLVSHYDNKMSLVNSHLNDLFNSKPMNLESTFEI